MEVYLDNRIHSASVSSAVSRSANGSYIMWIGGILELIHDT